MKKTLVLMIFCFLAITAYGQEKQSSETTPSKKGLIKIYILYPNGEGNTFDMAYYQEKHMPMVAELFGEALKGYGIDKGVAGRTPEEPMPYLAAGYFYFETVEAYGKAFGQNAEKILGDIPNYTNIQPVVQISEIIR